MAKFNEPQLPGSLVHGLGAMVWGIFSLQIQLRHIPTLINHISRTVRTWFVMVFAGPSGWSPTLLSCVLSPRFSAAFPPVDPLASTCYVQSHMQFHDVQALVSHRTSQCWTTRLKFFTSTLLALIIRHFCEKLLERVHSSGIFSKCSTQFVYRQTCCSLRLDPATFLIDNLFSHNNRSIFCPNNIRRSAWFIPGWYNVLVLWTIHCFSNRKVCLTKVILIHVCFMFAFHDASIQYLLLWGFSSNGHTCSSFSCQRISLVPFALLAPLPWVPILYQFQPRRRCTLVRLILIPISWPVLTIQCSISLVQTLQKALYHAFWERLLYYKLPSNLYHNLVHRWRIFEMYESIRNDCKGGQFHSV